MAQAVRGRPVTLTREGDVFRLAFTYDRSLVARAKDLPFASFDGESKSWTTRVTAQTLLMLRRWWHEGLCDVGPDDLLYPGEEPPAAREALLRSGTGKRPYFVHLATRDSNLFPAFRAIPGAVWDKKAKALSFPTTSAAALAEMLDRGTLEDPEDLLRAAEVTVAFDSRTGTFKVRGEARAAAAFQNAFPATDVVATWQSRGLDVDFLDEHTERMYRGELARIGDGIQPANMRVELMEHQRRAVAVAMERPGFSIFDEPGLGKTAQAIATAQELLNRRLISRAVIVVPAAVRTQWANEIVKFTEYTADQVAIVRGDPAKRFAAYDLAEHTDWFVVHYDILARDKEHLAPLFAGAFVVADEAHRIKNYKASRSEALDSLCTGAHSRMALTGTPTETHPGEWYQVLSFAHPHSLGDPIGFNDRYRYKARFGGYEGSRNLGELRERSRPYYIRRTKAEVAQHLPPLHVTTTVLDPSPAYAGMLRTAHAQAAEEIREANLAARTHGSGSLRDAADAQGNLTLLDAALLEEVSDGADMTAAAQLRLLCSSPRLINEDSASGKALIAAGLVPDEDGPKMDELRTICAELLASQERRLDLMASEGRTTVTDVVEVIGERIVLFTFSKRMANLISARLAEDGVKHVMFTGDTSGDDRDDAVAAFTDPNSDVIAFVATDAAAEGLNLGACCSTLINVDLPWTPSRLAQRSQRIHRLDGRADSHYQVTNLMVAGTMEHGVLRLIESRSDMADALFGDTGGRKRLLGTRSRGDRISFAAQALTEYADEHADELTRTRRMSKVRALGDGGAITDHTPSAAARAKGHTGRPNDRPDAGEATEPGDSYSGPDNSTQLSLL